MCGIAGIVGGTPGPDRTRRLEAMVRSLSHRGPDGHGTDSFPDASLGHTRLKVIDLSSAGAQPMRDASGNRSVVFNGEIYGYQDLRCTLEYPFRTHSDTEVLLALYDTYGLDMLRQLPGMFAFAIWDDQERTLFAARDRFGEKPFYYAHAASGAFVFGSEIKAVLASSLVDSRLDRGSLAHVLNRLYVPVGKSIYEDIQELRPGHALAVRDGQVKVWRYWELPDVAADIDQTEARDEFKRLFFRAVKRQLVADVEVGAFLSGGLDSSSVVSVASEMAPQIRTFSFGFEGGPNETSYARDVAYLCGTVHTELMDSQGNVAEVACQMASIFDEPFGDSSAVPTYMISRLAADQLKVVLTGDGADELLGGYPWYRDVANHVALGRNPAWLNECLYGALSLSRRLPGRRHRHGRRLQLLDLYRSGQTASEVHRRVRDFVAMEDLEASGLTLTFEQQAGVDPLDAAMRTDVVDYMAGDILVKIDRASMAHGLELRAPFLDVDLATFCLTLPSRLKFDGRRGKLPLRRAMGHRWPTSVRSRGKQGFAAPVQEWLKRPEFVDLKASYLRGGPGQQLRGIVGDSLVEKFADEDSDRTWALLMTSMWLNHRDASVARHDLTA